MMRWISVVVFFVAIIGPACSEQAARRQLAARQPRTTQVSPEENLQAALDQAVPGDTIVLKAGSTYEGNFRLPAKLGDAWITITSSDLSSLPAGRRVTPQQSGKMPRLVTKNSEPAIVAAPGAHHYRLEGLELTVASGVYVYDVVRLGELDNTDAAKYPDYINMDRLYIHGDPVGGGKRGVFLNARTVSITNSLIMDFKSNFQDANAIAVCNAPGPTLIHNSRLEGAGYGIIFGGCTFPAGSAVPTDVRFTHNHVYKPPVWKDQGWVVKNQFEVKTGRRMWIEGNVFENNWVGGQTGFGILFTLRADAVDQNQQATGVLEDVTFVNNIVINTPNGVNVLGRDDYRNNAGQLSNLTVRNNLFLQVPGRLFQFINGPKIVTVDHNTCASDSTFALGDGVSTGFVFTNNIVLHGEYGFFGSGLGSGNAVLDQNFPGAVFARNIIIGGPSYVTSIYPKDNLFAADVAAVGFLNLSKEDYRLSPSSRFKGKGTDGKDPGVDLDSLRSATEGTVEGVLQMPKISAVESDPTYGSELSLGGRIRVFGQNLASCEKFSDFPLPKTSCDATLTLNGQPAFLYYAGPQQLIALLPRSLPSGQDITAQVETNGVSSEPFSISGSNVAQYSPGAYIYFPDGVAPHALLLNSDGSLNGPAGDGTGGRRPIRAGEIGYLIAGGLGPSDPPVAEGQAAASSPSSMLSTLAGIFVNEVYQPVLAALVPPGTSGLYTLTFVLDPATPVRAPNENRIWIQCGGKESPRVPVSLQPI
jgi:uncharacterized protein (TIGR03437 family)